MPARSPLIFLPKAKVFDVTRKLEPELFPNETRSFHLSRVWVRLPLSQGEALVESRGSKRKPDQILFTTSLRKIMTDLQAGGQFVCPSVPQSIQPRLELHRSRCKGMLSHSPLPGRKKGNGSFAESGDFAIGRLPRNIAILDTGILRNVTRVDPSPVPFLT